MVHVPTLAQLAHQLRLDAAVTQDALVARRGDQPLHADGAVLGGGTWGSPHGCHTRLCAHPLPSRRASSPHPEGSSPSGCSDAPHPLGSCLPWMGCRSDPGPPNPPLPPYASSMGTVTGRRWHRGQPYALGGTLHFKPPPQHVRSHPTAPLVPQFPLQRLLTPFEVFLLGLPADAADPGHRLDVTLADGWRVQDGLGRTGQADRQSSSTHQDARHPCTGTGTSVCSFHPWPDP